MTDPFPANPELVCVAWLKGVPGLPTTAIGTTLPGPDSNGNLTWAASGFVQVGPAGGSPDIHVPIRHSVFSVDLWAANSGASLRPPWGRAALLGERIINDCYRPPDMGARYVTSLLPANYQGARVMAAYPLTEPRRMPSDPGSYARYQLDLVLTWCRVESP